MDTCKLKHEQNGKKIDSIQVSNLLKADSLEGRGWIATDEQSLGDGAAVYNDFEILQQDVETGESIEYD
jgi:hypothetical protein